METRSPAFAIKRLKQGNKRFISGLRSIDSMMGHLRMPDLAARGQNPFAVILTCSDSRSPAELIFDQGLGDLFVVRVAGNVVAPSLIASVEFAVTQFGSPLVVVLGHTLCGAVKATVEHASNPSRELASPHLEELVGRIRPAVEAARVTSFRGSSHGHESLLQIATRENVRRSCRLLAEQSRIIGDLVNQGKVEVVGAILDISLGRVDFIPEGDLKACTGSHVRSSSRRQQSHSGHSLDFRPDTSMP